jgi:outer membrane lipoprotein-sorting protein
MMRQILGVATACALVLTMTVPVRAADDDAAVRALVDKAIKAHGGADNLAKVKAVILKGKGKVHVMDNDYEYTSTISIQHPDKIRFEMSFEVMGMAFTFLQVFDGAKGWVKLNDKTTEMGKEAATEAREQMHARQVTSLLPLRGKEYKLGTLGEAKVQDKEAVGVLVSRKDFRDVSLWFDKKTGLLLKSETRAKDLQVDNNEYASETYYSDYKEKDGVQHAMKITIKRDGKAYVEAEATEIEVKDKLDAATFAKP